MRGVAGGLGVRMYLAVSAAADGDGCVCAHAETLHDTATAHASADRTQQYLITFFLQSGLFFCANVC
jgi:hypothetical protein